MVAGERRWPATSGSTDSMNPPLMGQVDDALLFEPSRRYRSETLPTTRRALLVSAQRSEVGVTPEMLVAEAEQGSRNESHACRHDRPRCRIAPGPAMAPARPFWSATGSLAVLKVGRQPQPAGVLPRCKDPTVEADAVPRCPERERSWPRSHHAGLLRREPTDGLCPADRDPVPLAPAQAVRG